MAGDREAEGAHQGRTQRRAIVTLAVLALCVLASRLPLLDAGYGLDGDAWALAGASRAIATSGESVPSRPPGYPLRELVGALFWRGGPPALNGLSALAVTVASLMVALVVRRARPGAGLPAGLAFAFTPAVYVASTSAMDCCWSIAFALAGFLLAARGRPISCGLAIGCAAGARLTALVFVLPCAWLLHERRPAALAVLVSALVAGLWFTPVLATLGIAGMGPTIGSYPSLRDPAATASAHVFGELGALAAALALSSFVGFERGPRPGELLQDHRARLEELEILPRLIAAARAMQPAPVVVAGPWAPKLAQMLEGRSDGAVLYVTHVTPDQARRFLERGRPLVYVDGIEWWHERIHGHALPETGARALLGTPPL